MVTTVVGVFVNEGTVVKDGLRTLVNENVEHMGLRRTPREHKAFTYSLLFFQ